MATQRAGAPGAGSRCCCSPRPATDRDGVTRAVFLDPGRTPVTVRLFVPGAGRADVQRLTAPAATSTSGIRLAGQRVGADGRPDRAAVRTPVRVSHGLTTTTVAPSSAALVTVTR